MWYSGLLEQTRFKSDTDNNNHYAETVISTNESQIVSSLAGACTYSSTTISVIA